MPNQNYIKGRRKEYKVMNKLKARGMIAFRSAGSHSIIDVVGIDIKNQNIELIQCKPDNIREKEKKEIELMNVALNTLFTVSFKVA